MFPRSDNWIPHCRRTRIWEQYACKSFKRMQLLCQSDWYVVEETLQSRWLLWDDPTLGTKSETRGQRSSVTLLEAKNTDTSALLPTLQHTVLLNATQVAGPLFTGTKQSNYIYYYFFWLHEMQCWDVLNSICKYKTIFFFAVLGELVHQDNEKGKMKTSRKLC